MQSKRPAVLSSQTILPQTITAQLIPTPQPPQPQTTTPATLSNLDRLAYAVAMAETANCTTGIGPRTHNCFGVMSQGHPKTYASINESYADFKRIWSTYYKTDFPTKAQADKYTGKDNADTWLQAVTQYYYE